MTTQTQTLALTRAEIHALCNALNAEANRFINMAEEATAARITPGSPRIPAQTVTVWRDHVDELRALRNYLLSGRRCGGAD